MELTKHNDGTQVIIALTGRLDAKTAPVLEDTVKTTPEDITGMVLDCENLEYLSSAGLRVIQQARKRFPGKALVLRKVRPEVMEILNVTGFAAILTIEE